MPNWCNNSITITGPAETVKQLWEDAKTADNGEFGLLQAMAPMPAELEDTEGLSEGPNWYSWRVDNWGTKWDISDEGLEFIDNGDGTAMITGYADSAWSPPIDAFQNYANANEDVYLEIKYFEPGMSFVGVWDSDGGDAYWEDVGALVAQEAENDDDVLMELFEHFNVWDWYEFDEEEDLIDEA